MNLAGFRSRISPRIPPEVSPRIPSRVFPRVSKLFFFNSYRDSFNDYVRVIFKILSEISPGILSGIPLGV